MTEAKMNIKEEMKALNYEPADAAKWNKLSEEEQRQVLVRKRNEREMVAARGLLRNYSTTKEFAALPKNIQEAIVRVCGKKSGGAGGKKNVFVETLKELFPKVNTAVSELDIFMKTKMGRGEFRKRVREALKASDAAQRMWIEFNDEKETWVLLSVGADMPKGFKGKALDE